MSTSHADSSRIEPDSTPLVSIVMPTYNRAHLVGEAIDAVLAQTYPHFELILVNDGSRDNTREVLDGYATRDPRIRVFHKENEGIPDTVNRGWRESRGELVTWTSDDNNYHPTAIEMMVHYLQVHRDVGLVYTDCRYINAEGRPLPTPPGREPDVLATDCPIMGCLLFRRSIFEHVEMFKRQWRRVHDYDFYRRVWKQCPVARIPQVLYDYRLHAASMTGNHYAMTTEHAQLIDSVAESDSERRAAWGHCWHAIARQAERDGQRWRAVVYYLRAAWQEPCRTRTAWGAFWRTAYGSLPIGIQNGWRRIKSRLRQPAAPK